MKCLICNNEFRNIRSLSGHIRNHRITSEDYYLKYINMDNLCKNKNCNNQCQFISITSGFRNYCSKKCSNSDDQKLESFKKSCLEKYGVENPFMSEEVKDKIKNTMLKNYGEENSARVPEFIDKKIYTNMKKYGSSHPMKNKQIKIKSRNERLKNYIKKHKKFLLDLDLELIDSYKNCKKTIIVKCIKCRNVFNTELENLKQNCRKCEICYPKLKNESKIENEIRDFLKENINEKLLFNVRNIIPPKELDIFIPKLNIAIEFNGLYWHSELNGKDKNYHYNKMKECEDKEIKLIQIFEDEWLYKNDICKNRLLHIIGETSVPIIYARKCKIKLISYNEKKIFLDKFHIQGNDIASINLGAFYKDHLVSVMTFSKGNIAKGSKNKEGIYELNRFCSDYNYRIVGVAGKLLSYFMRTYYWKEIYSYADRRWSIGNLYYNIGFSLDGETKPNYWYFKNGTKKRMHRFNLRKKLNEPKETPEWVLRQKEGYIRIWDCGNLKFKIENKEI